MKNHMQILLAILLGIVLPQMCLKMIYPNHVKSKPDSEFETMTTIQLLDEDRIHTLPVEDYVIGVLLAEIPPHFELEAIKAQAVAARTFALYHASVASKHGDADVCSSSSCCQGYISVNEYLEKGPNNAVQTMTKAVQATQGLVATYQNLLIQATYFSSSGGRTEDAVAVWGNDVPYLQSVGSPGEDASNHNFYQQTMDIDEFCQKLGISENWVDIGAVQYTDGGGIDVIEINGMAFKGTEVRSKLGLRSTVFAILQVGSSINILTRGFGHRVGLSQYGADAMAAAGCDYEQILKHYYTGVEIQEYMSAKN